MDAKKLYRLFYNKFHTSVYLNEKNKECKEDELKLYSCGLNKGFKKDFVQQNIEEYFNNENELYLIITSGNSSLIKITNISEEIGKYIHKKQIGVINKSLDKIMFFQVYEGKGVFKKAIVKEYPKSREKSKGTPLKISLHANMYEKSTKHISEILTKPFEQLEKKLNTDYGGNIEHLWIDIELLKDRGEYPFRFQKRVNIPSFSGRKEYYYNVGSYSIMPDFEKFKTLSDKSILEYILTLLYNSMEILVSKKKKLKNFNAEQFRSDFVKVCAELGCLIGEK